MSFDYRWAAQMRAEELAEERGLDYFDLPTDQQCDLYQEGLDSIFDNACDVADNARKRARENQP